MLHVLRRHPIPVSAFFRRALALTYAYPADVLRPLLPPRLELDTLDGLGFLTVALVEAERLRPSGLPEWLGRDVFLCGYRVFARFGEAGSRRGLRILCSLTDRRWMQAAGNLLTRYRYRMCRSETAESAGRLRWRVESEAASLDVTVETGGPAALPEGSPFADEREARRFAGPLPFTFDYEPETGSIVTIRGVRGAWRPRPARVEVARNTFLDRAPLGGAPARLANAFYLTDVPYRWEGGVRS